MYVEHNNNTYLILFIQFVTARTTLMFTQVSNLYLTILVYIIIVL